jgi:excisionase family DNA binding protein
MNGEMLKTETLKAEMGKAEIRNESRHLTPALSPIEAERVADATCVTRLELPALLRVSIRTVDRMIANGEIPVRRVRGYAVRFLRSDVEEYLKREKLKAEIGKATPLPSPLPDRGGEGASCTGAQTKS